MRNFWKNQNQNLFLWVPIIMAFGAALYFTMNSEPNISHPIISVICITIVLLAKGLNPILRAIGIFLFGFLYAAFFTRMINTPIITSPMRDINTDANVINIDFGADKNRAILKIPLNDGFAKVRLTLPESENRINTGDTININATLFPPAKMDAPDTFDYARWAYFNNLSATGFITEYQVIESADSVSFNNLRSKIHNIANSPLTDALVLGYKNTIAEKQTWTNIGIAHIWSISGFHMTLIGGWLFILFYLIFRSIGFITRRISARIPATICAWGGLIFYLRISGGGVATVRAFLMTSLLFIAIILGRNAINLRNVCLAFLIIFLINPYHIMQAGFQLSFAAIFGLVWFWNKDKTNAFIEPERQNKTLQVVYKTLMTTIIATLFTMPFVMAHFYSVPVYSLISNIILLPIFSFVIMPLVLFGTITSVFGAHIFLDFANYVYGYTLNIAHHISELPFATLDMPHISNAAFTIIIIGMLIIILVVSNKKLNYLIGSTFITVGALCVVLTQKPVFYITGDHELIGMVYDGKIEFNKARASNHYFAFNTFRKLNREPESETNVRHKCKDGVCIYKSDNFTIAYIQKFVPLNKNLSALCKDDSVNYIASYFDIKSKSCSSKILRNGFVIYKNGNIRYTPTNRYWHIQHAQKTAPTPVL